MGSEMCIRDRRTTPAARAPAATASGKGARRARSWAHDKADAKDGAAPFKQGKFSQAEGSVLRGAIERHLHAHPGTYDSVEHFASTAKKGEWLDVCAALPERSIHACYEYCRRHFSQHNYKGKWSAHEEARLRALHAAHGNKWAVIAEELGRERTGVRDKWRELSVPDRRTGAWTEAEDARLLELVSQACSADEQLMAYESAIPWTAIAAQMGGRSAKQCRTGWKRLAQAAGALAPEGGEVDGAELAAALYHSGVRDATEVTWEQFGRNAHRRFQLLCKATESGPAASTLGFRARVVALHRHFEAETSACHVATGRHR